MQTATKRQFLTGICLTSAGALFGFSSSQACSRVTASEDLMREHGVLRRILFAYSEAAARLRSAPASVSPDALQKAARLFRAFGEEYHEQRLEENIIFPALVQNKKEMAAHIGILIAQHHAGRELTGYILSQTGKNNDSWSRNATELAAALESLVRMYRPHAAREDTVIFPAWKESLKGHQYEEAGEKFEDIEKQQFGKDGFEQAILQLNDIEAKLGLADLDRFTATKIPKA